MSASRDTTSLSSRRTTRVNDVEREARSQERLQSYQRRPGHLSILNRRAAERNVSKAARDFAEALARGPCHDLLVVLLEPLEYFEMVTLQEGIAASHTLSEIDRILRECSNGVRSISNTAVLDVRVFLTARMRATMSPRELSYEEERSFAIFQQMVYELRPKAIVSCQCGTFNTRNLFVRQLCSRFPPPTNRNHIQILGQRTPVYRAFHPSLYNPGHIEHWVGRDASKQIEFRRLVTELLRLIFVKAFRALSNINLVNPKENALRGQLERMLTDRERVKRQDA